MLTVHWCRAPADCKRGPTPTDFEEWTEPFLFQLPRSHDVVAGSYLGSFQGLRHKRVCVREERESKRERRTEEIPIASRCRGGKLLFSAPLENYKTIEFLNASDI